MHPREKTCVLQIEIKAMASLHKLKEKRKATGGNIIFAWLNDGLMKSLLELSN